MYFSVSLKFRGNPYPNSYVSIDEAEIKNEVNPEPKP